jgi:hypothetical protein
VRTRNVLESVKNIKACGNNHHSSKPRIQNLRISSQCTDPILDNHYIHLTKEVNTNSYPFLFNFFLYPLYLFL